MPRTRNPYPAEFRDHLIALATAGRGVESLAREFEPCAATIHGWVKQAEADYGECGDGLTSEEREELRRLRREVKQLRQERDILSKAAAWFAHNDKLKGARSRLLFAICNRTRIAQTSRGFSGGLWPTSLPLFHGRWIVGYCKTIAIAELLRFEIQHSSTLDIR